MDRGSRALEVLFAWPEVLVYLLIGTVVTLLFLSFVLVRDRSLFARIWTAGRSVPAPPSRARRMANRVLVGLLVLIPALAVLVVLVVYLGWFLHELGWVSIVPVALVAVLLWFVGRFASSQSM